MVRVIDQVGGSWICQEAKCDGVRILFTIMFRSLLRDCSCFQEPPQPTFMGRECAFLSMAQMPMWILGRLLSGSAIHGSCSRGQGIHPLSHACL